MGLVETAVHHDLAKFPDDLANSALAALAVALAREVDDPGNSATSKSMNGRALIDALERLRELAPPEEKNDGLDDLKAKRAVRLAKGGTA